jgi:hypothetical protein
MIGGFSVILIVLIAVITLTKLTEKVSRMMNWNTVKKWVETIK